MSGFAKLLGLSTLLTAPPQVLGEISLVPLLRKEFTKDLRLQMFQDSLQNESIKSSHENPGSQAAKIAKKRFWYIPHGLIIDWNEDGSPIAAFGTQILPEKTENISIRSAALVHQRIARKSFSKEMKTTNIQRKLEFLPMDLAMEGFLSFHFGSPEEAWTDYSKLVLDGKIVPRWEWSTHGRALPGLEDALRTFEMHPGQVGILLFVNEEIASIFVTPHPDDYRALHSSLIKDFYGALISHFGRRTTSLPPFSLEPGNVKIRSMDQLRISLKKAKLEWSTLHKNIFEDSFGRLVALKTIDEFGPFIKKQFISDLARDKENFIGELIMRDSGRLEYLKTYRLSKGESRRTYLIERLSANGWDLRQTAASLGSTYEQLVERFEKSGFSYLLKEKVLNTLRKEAKRGKRKKR